MTCRAPLLQFEPVVCTILAIALWAPEMAPAAEGEPVPAPPFEAVCFEDFDEQQVYPSADQLRTMLQPAPGRQANIANITAIKRGIRTICALAGVHRLKTAWHADSVWRLGLVAPKELQLHFWSGREGITLCCYPDIYHTWAAYGTTRRGNEVEPQTYALWALDNGRYTRSKAGTFEIRWQDGRLVMTRGDLLLLCVPLRGPPQEVYLQGSAMVRGMAMLRSGPAPLAPVARPVVLRSDKPADLAWQIKPEGEKDVQLNRLPDGRVELVAAADAKAAQAAAKIDRPGLYEYIFEVEDAEPGTGIFLGDRQGQQLFRVGFFRHAESRHVTFSPWYPTAGDAERNYSFPKVLTPFAGRRQWVRVTLGAGVFRCYTSGDGLYWSELQPSSNAVAGACTTIGVYCCAGKARRAIKLRSIEVRRLDALMSLAPQEIVDRAAAVAAATSFADWQQRLAQSQPKDLTPEAWRRACALRTLIDNLPRAVGQPVLGLLLDDVVAAPDDAALKLRVLDEAGLLAETNSYGAAAGSFPLHEYYERLGDELTRQRHPTPLTTISRALLRMPGWRVQVDVLPQKLLHHELLTLTQQEQWQQVGELCRRARYWTRSGEYAYTTPPWKEGSEVTLYLLRWATAQAWLYGPKSAGGKPPLVRTEWRHPLIESLNKETFNVLAEFDAAVESAAYRDACQVILAAADPEARGLLPCAADRRLLVSLPAAVDLAMQNTPALRQAMQEHFGALGRLRMRQVLADSDPAAAAAVALRFHGSEAAAEAHRWLGDRWLSGGQPLHALGEYRQALRSTSPAERDGLLARVRLAGALLGRNLGQPASAPIELGNIRLTAAEFERTVQQVREARRIPGEPTESAAHAAACAPRCPAPGLYEVRPWADLQAPKDTVAWGGRAMTALAVGEQVIVNNQVQQASFDLSSGRQRWIARQQVKPKTPAQTPAPMQPALGPNGRIFVRRLTDQSPELACLDTADGRLLWSTTPAGFLASEPLWAGRELFALCVESRSGANLALDLAAFDPESGQLLRRLPLVEFADRWSGAIPCRATLAENRIVATVGGSVLCCDLLGSVLWVRRQVWVPPSEKYADAPLWRQQVHHTPLILDGRIYATQPGVFAVECLDLETGRLLWRAALPDITALLGCPQRRLVVETSARLLALDAESGKTLWQHDAPDRLDARCCGQDGGIIYAKLAKNANPKEPLRPSLVWLDPATGKVVTEATLSIALRKEPAFGPMIVHGPRQWVLLRSEGRSAEREVVELVPDKP